MICQSWSQTSSMGEYKISQDYRERMGHGLGCMGKLTPSESRYLMFWMLVLGFTLLGVAIFYRMGAIHFDCF